MAAPHSAPDASAFMGVPGIPNTTRKEHDSKPYKILTPHMNNNPLYGGYLFPRVDAHPSGRQWLNQQKAPVKQLIRFSFCFYPYVCVTA